MLGWLRRLVARVKEWGRREPVLYAALAQAVLAFLISIGVITSIGGYNVGRENGTAFLGMTSALLGFLVRSRVSPTPDGSDFG